MFKNSRAAAYYTWNFIYGNISTDFKDDWFKYFIEGWDNYG